MLVDIQAKVLRNTQLSKDYNVIALAAPEIAEISKPGQFVMIRPESGTDPLLRRPFSVFEVLRRNNSIEGLSLLNKRAGITTELLHEAAVGSVFSCLGPLGQPFNPIHPPAEAWLVAGGVGLAPFVTMVEAFKKEKVQTTLFYGARTSQELFYLDWFSERGVKLVLSTEDGSNGDRGRVTEPLERALDSASNIDIKIYACGPEPMLAAVAKLAHQFERPCEVSVERVMGCGMGGCYSCVIPVRDKLGNKHYVRSCLNGPVFSGDEIVWD